MNIRTGIKGLHEGIKVLCSLKGQAPNEKGAVIPGQCEEFILFRMDMPTGGLHGFLGAGRGKGMREDPFRTGKLVG